MEPNPDGSGRIPEEKIVLRYSNALSEKYRKYRKYLRERTVSRADAFVVAVNGAALSYKWTQAANDAPRFLKALYPLGAYQIVIDRRSGEIIGHQNEPRFNIVKASGANVAVMPFLERSSRGITAVLGSFADPMYHGASLGSDFELAHNPMGRAPISDLVLPARRAWRAVLSESGGELGCGGSQTDGTTRKRIIWASSPRKIMRVLSTAAAVALLAKVSPHVIHIETFLVAYLYTITIRHSLQNDESSAIDSRKCTVDDCSAD